MALKAVIQCLKIFVDECKLGDLCRPLPFFAGVSLPRGSFPNGRGSLLPSPRDLSAALISHEDRPDRDFTLLLMQWGQFVDHDITHTPLNKGYLQINQASVDALRRFFFNISASGAGSFNGRNNQQLISRKQAKFLNPKSF